MAIKSLFADLIGTTKGFFRIGINGPRLKNNSGDLEVKNSGDTAFVDVTADTFKATNDVGLTINSDAAGSGADWKINVARPATGMTADWTLTLPANAGSTGQVLETDGAGNTSWVSAGSNASSLKADSTTVGFGDSSPIALFTLPANAIIDRVQCIVDTPFDGTPTLTVGIAGDTAKYMGVNDNSLLESYVWQTDPGIAASVSSESLIATYSADGATVGSARVIVWYAEPA